MLEQVLGRRAAIRKGIAAVAALGLGACVPAGRTRTGIDASRSARFWLPPVRISEDRLIRTVAGLRPYRPSGFRVEAERLGDKLIVHNYGHGGAGVTLSWGTARLAVDHGLRAEHRRAAVIGCGAVGLATARLLQDRGFRVRIYARDLPPHTTSNMAGALWAPFGIADAVHREGPVADRLAEAARISHRYFQTLVGPRYGVRWLPLYMLGQGSSVSLPWTWQLTPELFKAVPLRSDEHPFPHTAASRIFVMMIEPDEYLRAVLTDFRTSGGEVEVRAFEHAVQLHDLEEPLIFNCTGLGARALFGDSELIPARGQLAFLVPQPEIEYMYLAGGEYMFPRSDGILLGGTYEPGNWSTAPDPQTTERILNRNRVIAEHLGLGQS